jgi:hypothetical protein
MNRPLCRLIAGLLVLSIASTARAELILPSAATHRERIAAVLNRDDVAAELARHGVRAEDVRARVAALSDAEAAALAGRIDAQPAGGVVGFGAALFLLIAAPVLVPIAVITLVVGGIAGIAAIASASSRNAKPVNTERVPATRPANTALASSPFPVSSGLYGAFVPAPADAAPAQATAE